MPFQRLVLMCVLSGALGLGACSGERSPIANTNPAIGGTAGVSDAGAGGVLSAGTSGMTGMGQPPMSGGFGGAAGADSGTGAGGSAGSLSTAGAPAGGTAGTGGTGGDGGAKFPPSEVVKILVLGSSNELGTCWRAFLWQKLRDAGIENFDLVGGVTQGPDCGVDGYDRDLQAQSGNRVSEWEQTEVTSWFADAPQIVLLHVGGADVLADLPLQGVMDGFDLALQQARLVTPAVEFMNAQHTPMAPAPEGTRALNAGIVTWAEENTTAESPITVVDLFTDVDTDADTTDGVHLNDSGSRKVADRFFAVLEPLFGRAAPSSSFPE